MASYNLNEVLKKKNAEKKQQSGNQEIHLDDVSRVKVLSPGRQVLKRFARNRLAVFGTILLLAMFVFSFLGPIFYPYGQKQIFYKYDAMNVDYAQAKDNTTYNGYVFDDSVEIATHAKNNMNSSIKVMQANDLSDYLFRSGDEFYKITKLDGTEIDVYTPLNYPDPAEIQVAKEPFAKVNILTPPEYVGAIMELCTNRRGEYKDMKYLDTTRVELHYSMPLNEIIYDFFDALKSRTRGYGSLDYELEGYRPSKLVKLDILLNGEIVDALSFILFADNAYTRARKICEKLKDNIPRQMFEIPVQAAIGGKVIARETIKALRKDVLAKCYGGDITRKKKLLEKQKEGKKRMRTFGTVSVPSEAFMAVLKLDE